MKEIEASLQRICNFKYNLEAILAEFKVGDLNELLDELLYTFKDSIDEFVYRPDYVDLFHDFLYALTESTSNPDDLDSIGVFDKRLFNIVKAEIKPYNNKKIKLEKDDRYNILNRLKSNLDAQYLTASNKMINIREDDNTRVLKFIIYEIKNPDILYQLLESKSEIVNKYIYDEHILHYIIKEFIINMDSMTKEDKEYFKRIISMMLIRNELKIYEKDFRDIYTDLDCKISKKENVRDCSYLKYIIQKHFEIRDPAPTIGSEFKEFKEVERDRQYDLQTIPDIDRYDLRSLPTFSIDYIKYAKAKKLLFDDAFSIEPTEFGTYALYFHRPDVDEYIPRDQLFDKYMKDRVMSIYSKPVIPMIPYKYACKMSLLKKRRQISFNY